MDWREHLTSNPRVLGGKPAVKGTRLAFDFILERFASGWTVGQLLTNYPSLTEESLRAVRDYATRRP
jgi:uncharacterized protein (DUF433 family)